MEHRNKDMAGYLRPRMGMWMIRIARAMMRPRPDVDILSRSKLPLYRTLHKFQWPANTAVVDILGAEVRLAKGEILEAANIPHQLLQRTKQQESERLQMCLRNPCNS